MRQKITPNLWFDHNAKDAVEFYVAAFPNSRIISSMNYPKTAAEGLADFQMDLAGDVLTIDFELGTQQFTAINAGPEFAFNPSISFLVNFDPASDDRACEHLDALWSRLIDGGEALMPLDAYPFSKRFGWVKDRYGLTWQLILTNPEGEARPFLIPALLFTGVNDKRAEEAIRFYLSLFPDSKSGALMRNTDGSLLFADFELAGQWFAAMDAGGVEHGFAFNEALSFEVICKDQAEIDFFWGKLSSVKTAEQCGWCKDMYGLSWQIVPQNMRELMEKPGAFAKLMEMKKLIIADF
jgi:predicted 3-demethylubiquinone-9 3-methyltransferase (glyoxalase superfamily)